MIYAGYEIKEGRNGFTCRALQKRFKTLEEAISYIDGFLQKGTAQEGESAILAQGFKKASKVITSYFGEDDFVKVEVVYFWKFLGISGRHYVTDRNDLGLPTAGNVFSSWGQMGINCESPCTETIISVQESSWENDLF